MEPADVLQPLGVFVVVVLAVVAGTAITAVAFSGSLSAADGADIRGQSPGQFQPSSVIADADDEAGEIELGAATEDKRILIDTQHGNRIDRDTLQPVVDALVAQGHTVRYTPSSQATGTQGSYNATLRRFDAVLIAYPTVEFSEDEIAGLQAYAEGGGRVVVLGGPTEIAVTTGLVGASTSTVRFGANTLVGEFGMQMGSDLLYNVDDENNDNNYKSIYAEPAGSGALTDGVETVNLDASGYIVVPEGSDAEPVLMAADGARRFSTRRGGEFVTAARNGNFVLVSDETFITDTDVYDVDNEQFVSNLLTFMVTGDKPDDVPRGGDGLDTGPSSPGTAGAERAGPGTAGAGGG